MTWSIQLTVWALPTLLAVLLALRDAGYLWPRRRESGALALAVLATVTGVWSLLHLAGMVGTSREVPWILLRGEFILSAGAVVAWAWFALTFSRKAKSLRRPAMVLVYAATAWTVFLSLRAESFPALAGSLGPSPAEDPATPLYGPGGWYWVHGITGMVVVVTTGWVVLRHLHRRGGGTVAKVSVSAAVAGVAVATLTGLVDAADGAVSYVRDPGPFVFATGTAIVVWGLLRRRLRDIGPVARTLVMLELRDPIVVLDGRGRIVDLNRAAEDALGLKVYGDVPLRLGTLWAQSRSEPGRSEIIALPGGDASDDSAHRSFEVTVTPLDDRGAPGRSALLLRDVTEREEMARELRAATTALLEANHELERLANTDSLTGLANRRHFMDALQQELDRTSRYQRPLTLLLLDLDHFKKVNDTHGHPAGDEVLREAARAILSVCREVDTGARLGGEEMAILLPETDAEGALTVAERLRKKIWQTQHRSPAGASFRITTSIGVATTEKGGTTAETLLQRADEALYEAKEGGRNQVVTAS
ncbi:MAG: diguanylate cyclase [Gemmatimonadota bacterium]|nr:diguanylate cyclase [Gemmatimonadota bacterium]MDH5758450.1 diguanylate cyclase [Gemmatimonadota bacterium]